MKQFLRDPYRPRQRAGKASRGLSNPCSTWRHRPTEANSRGSGFERGNLQNFTMEIPESQLASIHRFGYTEAEARFLHIAATHSGYFTVQQFLSFAQASHGKRNARLVASKGQKQASRNLCTISKPSWHSFGSSPSGFFYLARVDFHFEKAQGLSDSLVTIPLRSDVSTDPFRYFQIRKAWDLSRYTSLTEADLIFRNQAKTRFAGQRFEHLYRGWKLGRASEFDMRQEFGGSNRHATVNFLTEVLCRFAVPEREPERKG